MSIASKPLWVLALSCGADRARWRASSESASILRTISPESFCGTPKSPHICQRWTENDGRSLDRTESTKACRSWPSASTARKTLSTRRTSIAQFSRNASTAAHSSGETETSERTSLAPARVCSVSVSVNEDEDEDEDERLSLGFPE